MTFLKSKFTANLNRYVLASLLANAFVYIVFALIWTSELTSQPITAFLTASILSFPVSFYLNRIWVFKSTHNLPTELLRFTFGYLLAMLYGALLLNALVSLINNPYIAQFVSIIILGISSFLLHSFWTFKKH
jgi:putative flippase GtrA